jgi:hypothetical protein
MDTSKTRDRVTPLFPPPVPKTQRFIVLPNGRLIPEALAYAFRDQVKRRAPLLSRDRRYKLEQISGAEFWAPLTDDEVRLGGMYITQLVLLGQLPLEFDPCPHASPKRYRIK